MVYLAREDDSPADREGLIEWHLRVNRDDYEIGKVSCGFPSPRWCNLMLRDGVGNNAP